MKALTISQLEEATGVPRSTIYYYMREGLLPVAQKVAACRAVYADAHVHLLREVVRLKDQGLALPEIKEMMSTQVASAQTVAGDLMAEQAGQARRAILLAAARLFASKGYKRTRVADIIKAAGVTAPLFYSHFSSKQELFLEAFGALVGWMRELLAGCRGESDPAKRDLVRVHGYLGLQKLSPDLLSLVRSEAMQEDGDMRKAVERSFEEMTRGTREDLVRLREKGAGSLPAVDELMAFGLLGGVESIVVRASRDEKYSTKEVLWTTLCMFLGVESVYSGRTDVSEALAKYGDLVCSLAETPPCGPPGAAS